MKPALKIGSLLLVSFVFFFLAASGQAPSDDEKGKKLVDTHCASCHEPTGWAHTKEDWEGIAPDMAAKGGTSPNESELKLMVSYLARHFGPGDAAAETQAKPADQAASDEEAGKKLLDQVCASCHDAAGWMHTKSEWEVIAPDHASRGGQTLKEEQMKLLVAYLTKHFGSK